MLLGIGGGRNPTIKMQDLTAQPGAMGLTWEPWDEVRGDLFMPVVRLNV